MLIKSPEPVFVTPRRLNECLRERAPFIWPAIDTVGMWDESPTWPRLHPAVPLEVAQWLGRTIAAGRTFAVFTEGCPLAWWSEPSGLVKPVYLLAQGAPA